MSRTRKKNVKMPPDAEQVIQKRLQTLAYQEEIRTFFQRAVLMAILLCLLFGVFVGLTPMKNNAMFPRISAGDLILYYRLEHNLLSGDVIVFEKDSVQYVGRIVAKGGDTVEITEKEVLKINNSIVLEHDIYYPTYPFEGGIAFPVTLNTDQFFVLGDYREEAKDSRYFGPVNIKEIKGKVISVIRRSGL